MHAYIDLYFSPEGVSPLEIAERVHQHVGLTFIVGEHDLVMEWSTPAQFRILLDKVHEALKGTGVRYRVESVLDDPTFVDPIPWPPPMSDTERQHPAYSTRA